MTTENINPEEAVLAFFRAVKTPLQAAVSTCS